MFCGLFPRFLKTASKSWIFQNARFWEFFLSIMVSLWSFSVTKSFVFEAQCLSVLLENQPSLSIMKILQSTSSSALPLCRITLETFSLLFTTYPTKTYKYNPHHLSYTSPLSIPASSLFFTSAYVYSRRLIHWKTSFVILPLFLTITKYHWVKEHCCWTLVKLYWDFAIIY